MQQDPTYSLKGDDIPMTQETEELAPSVMAASDRIKKTSKAPTKPLPDQNLDLANIQGVGILDS